MGNTKNENLIFRYKLFLAVTHSMTFEFLEMYKLSLICLIFISSKRFTQIFVCDTKLTGEIGYILFICTLHNKPTTSTNRRFKRI